MNIREFCRDLAIVALLLCFLIGFPIWATCTEGAKARRAARYRPSPYVRRVLAEERRAGALERIAAAMEMQQQREAKP